MSKVFRRTHDPIWHLQAVMLGVIGLQLLTAPSLLPYSKPTLIVLELLMMVMLAFVTPDAYHQVSRLRRSIAMSLLLIVALVNSFSLVVLVETLVHGSIGLSGADLLISAGAVYATNIAVFAILYWEMDAGGPDRRVVGTKLPDFLFTQMAQPKFAKSDWLPGFSDYLYLSATNTTNFASAETVPLTHRAKAVMMLQSLVAVATVVLVTARAITLL